MTHHDRQVSRPNTHGNRMAQIRTKTKTKKKLWRSSSRGKGVAPTRWDDVRAGGLGRWWWWWWF